MKILLFCLLVLTVVLAGCQEQMGACTLEAKVCPDGSHVGKVPPDCEFEPCPEVVETGLSYEETVLIAEASECTEKGDLTDGVIHNTDTATWWIDLQMRPEFEEENCNPACVVDEVTKTAEINWRCTGLLPP